MRSIPRSFLSLLLGLLLCPIIPAAESASLTVTRQGRLLELAGRVPAGLGEVEIRIESARNARMSRISDVSPLTPKTFTVPVVVREREIFYPIVDVVLQPGMEGVLAFSAAPKTVHFNQHFYKTAPAPAREMILGADRISFWENAVGVEPADIVLEKFHLRVKAPVIHGGVHRKIELLSASWAGRITLHASDGQKLAEALIQDMPAEARPAPQGEPLSPARLRAAVVESAAYVLRAQERNPVSPVFGGLNIFYDLDASTHRSNYWIWGWGPAVRMLLDAGQVPAIAANFAPAQLPTAAAQIGRASLRFMVEDPAHPARGVPVSRWNRNVGFSSGFEERISVADAQFLSGWAWLPLYRATGDQAFLAAAKTLAEATDRLTGEHEVIPQDYYQEPQKWSEHILDESGFSMEGLAELYATTQDARHREIGRKYFESVRTKLQRPDGLWNRGWNRVTGVMPAIYVTRGMGWAMEGLLAAHRAMPDAGYLVRAEQMAEHLMRWQHPDGSWSFNAPKPVAEVGVADKGTALWSLLFYRLHQQTGDPRHLAAAQRALRWCVENQYFGPDPEARGAIIGVNQASAVGYRGWFRVSCTYASGFFGLAALEELKRLGEIPAH